jgi:hypothetical protein
VKKRFKLALQPDKDFKTRPVDPKTDLEFIYSSWLKSYRQSEFAKNIPSTQYFPYHHNLITTIIAQPTNNTTILCDPDDESTILGYIVYNTKEPIVFYMYIKHTLRRFGLGKYLLESIRTNFGEESFIKCTHKVQAWSKVNKKHNLIFNPYLIKEEAPDESS